MKNIIEVESLKKTYKITDIFENIKGRKKSAGIEEATFSVKKGEIFSIIGVNGAGKTTIMKCILNLIKPDSGKVSVFGKERLTRKDYYKIGYLPEISYYPKEVKLKEIIAYYSELYGMDKKSKINTDEILKILDLNGRKNDRLEKFSKGMLQRVGIAQAVMNNPELLFLDEPMTGLDPLGQKLIQDILLKMKSEGTTIVLNTHLLSDVEKLSDKIAVVHEKRVKRIVDFKNEIKNIGEYKIRYISKENGETQDIAVLPDRLDEIIKKISSEAGRIIEIKREETTLEKFFMDMITEEENETNSRNC